MEGTVRQKHFQQKRFHAFESESEPGMLELDSEESTW